MHRICTKKQWVLYRKSNYVKTDIKCITVLILNGLLNLRTVKTNMIKQNCTHINLNRSFSYLTKLYETEIIICLYIYIDTRFMG